MSFTLAAAPAATVPQKSASPVITLDGGYVIVCGAQACTPEKNAAKTLQKYLKQISGIELAVVDDTVPASEKEIIVGKTNREGTDYTVDRSALGDEGIMFLTKGKKLIIAGGEKRGTLYAVYEFLYKYFDCRWYTKDVIVIPGKDKLEIPADIDYSYVPVFEYRETDWISPRDEEYSIANHLNSNIYRYIPEEKGGTYGYVGGFCHTMASLVPASYFESDPEMFALGVRDGKRTTDQPCLTNPKTLEVAIESVRNILRQNPKAIVSITQNDNQNYCVCDKCKAVDEEEGSHSGTMIRFVNAIAEALGDEFPDAAFDTFAYQYTRKAPKLVKPLPNVIVRVCSIECCFAHPLSDDSCSENADFQQDMLDWQAICNRIYVWDYTTNYANYLGPFPDFGVLAENMSFYADNHVKGMYAEGNYTASESNGEFAELRAYLLSRLAWDPYMDSYDEEMLGFCNAYYGAAGPYIKQYIDMTTENTGTRYFFARQHMGIYKNMKDKGVLNLNIVERYQINALWEKAKACELSEAERTRVLLSEISWRYWKACNNVCEFTRLQCGINRLEQKKQLYQDMKKLGITRLREGDGGLLSDDPMYFSPPGEWTK